MSDRRLVRWATTSARVAAGTAVAVSAVVGTVVAIAAPWPSYVASPVRLDVAPAPSDTVLACDGPLLALGRTASSAGGVSVAAPQQIVSGPATSAPSTSTLSGATGDATGGAQALRAAPRDGAETPLAAAGSATAAAGDLTGFAASACRPPLSESWLVAGASTTGANDLVVLGNPGTVSASVQLSVYGAKGVTTPPGGSQLVVPPGTQRVVPLAGLLLGEESPVVRVVSNGAPVHASLQADLTRVLLPGGTEQAAPLAQADTRQVIPGVQVLTTGQGQAGTLLRLLSPGSDTTATVTVTAVGGAAQPARDVPLTAGVPTSLDLSGLPVGAYTIDVAAAQPVVAAAWSTTGFGQGDDFAWYVPAPRFASPGAIAVAPGPGAKLVIAAEPGAGGATATLAPATGGTATTITVPAGGSTAVDVSAGVFTLTPDAAVRAEVTYSGTGALSAYPLWPADAAAPPITILP